MNSKISKTILLITGLCLVSITKVKGQNLNQPNYNENNINRGNQQDQIQQNGLGSIFGRMKTVNVPLFYDMVRNGNSLGINVLQGLVRVEKGEEAERSGLRGPRPLSVRVFGIPVYERGTRNQGQDFGFQPVPKIGSVAPPRKVEVPTDDEELPIIT